MLFRSNPFRKKTAAEPDRQEPTVGDPDDALSSILKQRFPPDPTTGDPAEVGSTAPPAPAPTQAPAQVAGKSSWFAKTLGLNPTARGERDLNRIGTESFNRWKQSVAGNPELANDPEVLKNFASKAASNYFRTYGRMPEPEGMDDARVKRSEEHTSELQSH